MAQTGRLGCRGNATGASTKYEGQSKPWHRPKGAETLGIIAGHRGWTTAELDEGEMGGEEAQPPPVFQATGPTSQLGGAGTDGAVPRALRARGSWRQVGGGGTGPEGPGRLTSGLQQEFARPDSLGEQCRRKWGSWEETCLPLLGPRWGRSQAKRKPRSLRGQRAGMKQTQPRAAHANPPASSALPSVGCRSGAQGPGDRAPPLPWCCLGCSPGAPEPSAGPAPHVGSHLSPPRGLQRAGSPAGRAQGTSSRGDREGRAGTLDIRSSQ